MLCWPVNGLPELFGTNIIIADFVGFLAGDIQMRNFPETEECSAINQNFTDFMGEFYHIFATQVQK